MTIVEEERKEAVMEVKKEMSEDFSETKALLERQRNAKGESCLKEIEKVLKHYNCSLGVSMLITEKGNFPQIQVIVN